MGLEPLGHEIVGGLDLEGEYILSSSCGTTDEILCNDLPNPEIMRFLYASKRYPSLVIMDS